MNIREYLREKGIRMFFVACIYGAAGAFMYGAGVRFPIICLMEITFLCTGSVILFYDYFKRKRYYRELTETLAAVKENACFVEVTAKPDFWDGKIVHDLIGEVGKYYHDRMAEQMRANREYRQYIESWVHEIKLPIAAAQLVLSNHPGGQADSVAEELKKIEAYVQQVLYYARSEGVEKDYCIGSVSLKEMVLKELAEHAREMIAASVRPVVDVPDQRVLADTKWCRFILRQIISNAVKYRCEKDAVLRVFCEENREEQRIWLVIADNGIGIPEKDLQRVTEKGFTGDNGRKYGASTGMGLYLCKKLCDKMELDFQIHSASGRGTSVRIGFAKS